MTGARRLHGRARRAAAAASCCPSTSAWPSSSTRSASAASPALAAVLDHLESSRGPPRPAEAVRGAPPAGPPSSSRACSPSATASSTRPPTRYLDLLKGALLDEHYLENELRIQRARAPPGSRGSSVAARAARPGPAAATRRRGARGRAPGRAAAGRASPRASCSPTSRGRPWAGSGSITSRPASTRSAPTAWPATSSSAARAGAAVPSSCGATSTPTCMQDPTVWVADTFRGRPCPTPRPRRDRLRRTDRSDATGLASARRRARLPGPAGRPQHRPRRLRPLRPARRPGAVRGRAISTRRCPRRRSSRSRCCASAAAWAEATGDVLDRLYDKVAVGGLRHHRRLRRAGLRPGRRRASAPADGVPEPLERIDWAGASWRKRRAGRDRARRRSRARRAATTESGGRFRLRRRSRADGRPRCEGRPSLAVGAPLIPPAPERAKDLSVVVVFYNMRREAARTLALAVPRLPRRHRRSRLRGDRRRERLGPRPAARRGLRAQLRPRVPLRRPRRRRPALAGLRAEPTASPAPRAAPSAS